MVRHRKLQKLGIGKGLDAKMAHPAHSLQVSCYLIGRPLSTIDKARVEDNSSVHY